jgi:hypothetical protein
MERPRAGPERPSRARSGHQMMHPAGWPGSRVLRGSPPSSCAGSPPPRTARRQPALAQSRPDPTRRYPRPDPTRHPAGRRARLAVRPVRRRQEEWSPVARRHGRPHPRCFPSPGPSGLANSRPHRPRPYQPESSVASQALRSAAGRTAEERRREGRREENKTAYHGTDHGCRPSDRQDPGLRLAPGVDGGPAESTASRLGRAAGRPNGPAGAPFRVPVMNM